MASRDGSRAKGRGRRQTRSGLASASDEEDYTEQPTVKRTTRRTSIITVEPKGHPENGMENFSVHEVQDQQVGASVLERGNCHGGRHESGTHCVQHPLAAYNVHTITANVRTSLYALSLRGTRPCGRVSKALQHDKGWAQQGAGEEHGGRSAPPATSERLRATAGRVGGQIQDTLSSAMEKAGLSWRTVRSRA